MCVNLIIGEYQSYGLKNSSEILSQSDEHEDGRNHVGGFAGAGLRRCGGDGTVREMGSLCDCCDSVVSERHRVALYGGEPGDGRMSILIREGKSKALPSRRDIAIRPGDVLRIQTPGEGGFGRAED